MGSPSLKNFISNIQARPEENVDDTYAVLVTKNIKNEKILHKLVPNSYTEHIKRSCILCKMRGEKFASGQLRKTYYRCSTCNVYLCRPQTKPCFVDFHRMNFNVDSNS